MKLNKLKMKIFYLIKFGYFVEPQNQDYFIYELCNESNESNESE